MNSDDYYMSVALQEAKKAFELGEIPVGAVVVAEGRIIGKGHNQTQQLNDASAHAEMIAMTSASSYLNSRYLNECTLYVTLEPCVMCAGASFWSQIGKVVYGAEDEKRGYHVFNEKILHPKTIVEKGVLREECLALLQAFFQKLRDKKR